MKVKSESEVAQSCPTLSDPMDHSLPGSSVRGIFQARVLEWGAIAFSKALDGGLQIQMFCLLQSLQGAPAFTNYEGEGGGRKEEWEGERVCQFNMNHILLNSGPLHPATERHGTCDQD